MLDPNESLLGKISDMTQDQFNISLLKSIKIRIYKLDEFPTQSIKIPSITIDIIVYEQEIALRLLFTVFNSDLFIIYLL